MSKQILAEGNNTVQSQVFLQEDQQNTADGGILTYEELENSKLINAVFFSAQVQVPNDYAETKDQFGTTSKEAIWDHTDPQFADFEMIKVTTPNHDTGIPTEVIHYVTPFHIKRWPDRYRSFKAGLGISIDGTPIEQLSTIPKSVIPTLQAAGILTIEQLAKAGNAGHLIMNGNAYQAAARKFLAALPAAEAEELKSELAELKAQMAELLAAQKVKPTK